MKKEIYNKLKEQVNNLEVLLNGGKGSGNFGHSGRPGKIGGSGKGIGSSYYSSKSDEELASIKKDLTARIQKLEKERAGVGYKYRYGSEEYNREKEDIQYELDSAYDQRGEVDSEIKERIHKKYLDQGLSNIQEKTVAEQEKKIEALRKIKTEYRDAVTYPAKDELSAISRLDKQEKDALEYLEKLKKIEASKKKKNGIKMRKETYNELKKRIDSLESIINGGKGSGNFGHSGRPGQVGGSGKGGIGYSQDELGEDIQKFTRQTLDDFDQINLEQAVAEAQTTLSSEAEAFRAEGNDFDADVNEDIVASLSQINEKATALTSCVGNIMHSSSPINEWSSGGVDQIIKANAELSDTLRDLQNWTDEGTQKSFQAVIDKVKTISELTDTLVKGTESLFDKYHENQ